MNSVRWFNTLLKVRDGKESVRFYEQHFNMTLINSYTVGDKFTVYYLATLPKGVKSPTVGTPEAHTFTWTDFPGTLLELLHVHGTEKLVSTPYVNGNVEPYRGFGHIAFNTEDVYEACEKLEAAGVGFQKKPNEGRMKGLAFALDPDGYWVEIVSRAKNTGFGVDYNLSQTMLRVKDVGKSLAFYRDLLGMKVETELHFKEAAFSLYFLGGGHADPGDGLVADEGEQMAAVKKLFWPILELTHNHGTESDDDFQYYTGRGEKQGFGSVGFISEDAAASVKIAKEKGYEVISEVGALLPGMGIVADPDGYPVKFYQKGGMFNGL